LALGGTWHSVAIGTRSLGTRLHLALGRTWHSVALALIHLALGHTIGET
jgi:hypothetical protein